MKRTRLYLCLAMLLCICFSVQAQTFSGNGSGTADDPYQVTSAEQLREMHNFIGAAHEGTHFILMNDIDLDAWITANNPTEGWIPIGQSSATGLSSFRGHFHGNYKTISNIWIDRTTYQTGLFASANMGSIENLTVKVKEGKSVKAGNYTGILVGDCRSRITNCHVYGTVEGGSNIGGLAGYANAMVKDCSADCIINKINWGDSCGGLIGGLRGNVENCTSAGEINSDGNYVGGLIGKADMGYGNTYVISYCNTSVKVNGAATSNSVGGLLGGSDWDRSVTLKHSFATGDVVGNNYVGGIIGESFAVIENCYTAGNVTGNSNVGGIMGIGPGFSNCYATGTIIGTDKVGGLAGTVSESVSNSVAASPSIEGTNAHRLVGSLTGTTASCFALETMTVNGATVSGGTADGLEGLNKTLVQLQTKSTYEDDLLWNFESTWKIAPNEYPKLFTYEELTTFCLTPEDVSVTTTFNEGRFDARISWVSTNSSFNIYRNDELIASNITGLYYDDNQVEHGTHTWCVRSACTGDMESDPACVEADCILPNHTITVSSLGFGTIFPKNDVDLVYGESKRFTFTPDDGVELLKILIDGVNVPDSVASRSYTFNSITADQTIEAIFGVKFSGEGDGTADNPYQIAHIYHFAEMRHFVSTHYGNPHFILMNNIYMTAWIESNSYEYGWEPIGKSPDYAFHGVLHGNNKIINGFWMDRHQDDYVGLFGIIGEGGSVENLGIEMPYGGKVMGRNYTGGLAGSVAGNITNCHILGTVEGGTCVGGLVGEVKGGYLVSGCSADCTVSAAGKTIGRMFGEHAGVLIGISHSPVEDCHSSGTLNTSNDRAGGLIGESFAPVTNCSSSCQINGSFAPYGFEIGGLIGQSHNKVSYCYATGNVDGNGVRASGGLIGRSKDEVVDCYATGDIYGYFYTGGLIGNNEGSVTNCHAIGDITGTNQMGGLVGISSGAITGSYATGDATGSDHVGGLIGLAEAGDIHNCYATGKLTATSRVTDLLSIGAFNSYFGGLIGQAYFITITDSYSTGDVYAPGNWFVGGIVGYGAFLDISNCYVLGDVTGSIRTEYSTATCVGGIAGIIDYQGSITNCVAANGSIIGGRNNVNRIASYVVDGITNCFASKDIMVNGEVIPVGDANGPEGLSKPFTTLQLQSTYEDDLGWDFSTLWKNNCDQGMFPIFQWQPDADCVCSAPRSLMVDVDPNGRLFNATLSWESLSESFDVYRGDELIASGITSMTYTDYGLTAGDYEWCVVADCADRDAGFACIEVSLIPSTLLITASASEGGSISPDNQVSADYGEDKTFIFSADAGYGLVEIVVDGLSIPSSVTGYSYTFRNITEDHSIVATFEKTTGIRETSASAFAVYPNPTTGKLKIETDGKAVSNIKLYDWSGVLLHETANTNDTVINLDITGYPAGVYILKIDGQAIKVIKN